MTTHMSYFVVCLRGTQERKQRDYTLQPLPLLKLLQTQKYIHMPVKPKTCNDIALKTQK